MLRRASERLLERLASCLEAGPSLRSATAGPHIAPQELAHATAGQWFGLRPLVPFSTANAFDTQLKTYKPVTPGLRGRVTTSRVGLWRGPPFKPLTHGLRKTGGRGATGQITAWHRGGGSKRLYRKVDFWRPTVGQEGTVERFEYDPNRSARLALINYGQPGLPHTERGFGYILAPQNIQVGAPVMSSPTAAIRPGNTLPLSSIPVGQTIHNVELLPGRGGQLARAAGTAATLISKGSETDPYAVVRLPSGERRRVLARCLATIGALSNPLHKNVKHGKAGARRWQGRRPIVRGVAMNSVDHPHGGGRGKSKGRLSQTPWGKPTKGFKTRRRRSRTSAFITLPRAKAKLRGYG